MQDVTESFSVDLVILMLTVDQQYIILTQITCVNWLYRLDIM